ncbi:MAG: hypothetical protein O3A40_09555 [Bacteroidetes bacterium]|nr:hypothetical protein [Bacteroidota bacterium]
MDGASDELVFVGRKNEDWLVNFCFAKLGNNRQVIDQSHLFDEGSDAEGWSTFFAKRIKNFKCFGMHQGEVFQLTIYSLAKVASASVRITFMTRDFFG